MLKCLDHSNVKVHIQLLNTMYQQLKGMGEEISESDFTTLILTPLPKSYRPLINTISLQNRVNTSKPLKPSTVMESILEEFDRLQIKECQSKAAENAMLAKGGKGKGKKKKGSTQQSRNVANPDINCWNCGEKDHSHTRCPSKIEKETDLEQGKGAGSTCDLGSRRLHFLLKHSWRGTS